MSLSQISANIGSTQINFKTGELAKQANGAVLAEIGQTSVLVTACLNEKPSESTGYFPLLVNYQEKTYAAGKIPGGFFKKEGRPKDTEILTGRVIDRSIRPLFDPGIRNNIQVIATVLSSDAENDPDIVAVNAASCALTISEIPFNGPIGAVRVIHKTDSFIVNPTYEQRQEAELNLIVVGTKEKILMIEAQAQQSEEALILESIKIAHKSIQKIIETQETFRNKVGKEKKELPIFAPSQDLINKVKEKSLSKIEKIYSLSSKEEQGQAKDKFLTGLCEELETEEITSEDIGSAFEKAEKDFLREKIITDKKRPDSRNPEDIRQISCSAKVFPRTHGSALFTRGQTQSLAITTLGTTSDEQRIEDLEGQSYKHFMLHYSFPPFSVGEVSPLRGPSRREIGHGTLAEKAIEPLLPTKEEFPYTIRVVSEILESNGSSSMASVCAANLSLMDAGVPLKDSVAGLAIGLITHNDKHLLLTDIAGIEDHYGDMDFKIAGTKKGITAIQLDLKIIGIGYDIIEETLNISKEARTKILEKMNEVLPQPRDKVSEFAPKIKYIKIPHDKIGELIGPGGRNIKKIINTTGASVDIDDETSTVTIAANTESSLSQAIEMVEGLTKDAEIGKVYNAKVAKVTNFGAFCEILPGKSGLVHVSELSSNFVKNVSDVISEGDTIKVKVISIDDQGRINLSKKQVDENKDN